MVFGALEGSSLPAGTPSARCESARGRSESNSRRDLYAEFRMEVTIVKERLRRWLAPLPPPVRRILILLIGSTVVLFGVLLLVLPGPGILVIVLGLAILATEFAWAEALLLRARERAARLAKKFGNAKR